MFLNLLKKIPTLKIITNTYTTGTGQTRCVKYLLISVVYLASFQFHSQPLPVRSINSTEFPAISCNHYQITQQLSFSLTQVTLMLTRWPWITVDWVSASVWQRRRVTSVSSRAWTTPTPSASAWFRIWTVTLHRGKLIRDWATWHGALHSGRRPATWLTTSSCNNSSRGRRSRAAPAALHPLILHRPPPHLHPLPPQSRTPPAGWLARWLARQGRRDRWGCRPVPPCLLGSHHLLHPSFLRHSWRHFRACQRFPSRWAHFLCCPRVRWAPWLPPAAWGSPIGLGAWK